MHLSEIARRQPDTPAVISQDGSRLTYAELDRASLHLAGLLDRQGLVVGDHVAILMENRSAFFSCTWAALRRGLYLTPINWHLTPVEGAFVLQDCEARVLFTSRQLLPLATALREAQDVAAPPLIICVDDLPAQVSQADPVAEVEGTYFFYSSGTTGRPKGIRQRHSFRPFGRGLGIDRLLRDHYGFDETVRYLCPAPLYHSSPLGWSIGTQRNGGTVVLMQRFDPENFLQLVERDAVTHAQVVPTMLVRLLELPERTRESYDRTSLRFMLHASAPCPVQVKERAIAWLGPILEEMYAGSEANGITTIGSAAWLEHKGSVGKPLMGEVHILDQSGQHLPPGEIGTVYFSGGWTFAYLRQTVAGGAGVPEGWTTLGDVGHVDADGYLYLADRRSDLILSGGVNLYPREVEDVIGAHPAVADVAVVGVADEDMGQRVRAVVQLEPGWVADADLQEQLAVHCVGSLARFKRPTEWRFTAQIPRTETGKLLRREVSRS
jgi:long-chain acyl-CoA synthetase